MIIRVKDSQAIHAKDKLWRVFDVQRMKEAAENKGHVRHTEKEKEGTETRVMCVDTVCVTNEN